MFTLKIYLIREVSSVFFTPPPHTHTTKQRKGKKHSTLECRKNSQILKISDHKNVNKNPLTPLKLYSKKHDKKVLASRDGWGGAIKSVVKEEPRPV